MKDDTSLDATTLGVTASRDTLDEQPGRDDAPPPGTAIGRYVVKTRLGSGAMGVVVEALDPRLGRSVAIKLLNRTRSSPDDDARMVREAQALARLSHPHVVEIFDVGRHETKLFIAMELVRGQTITQWLRTHPAWSEVVRVFEEAGRGLAAAHEAMLVHRDFKPDNVMLDEEGRARVMDFGLARGEHEGLSESPAPDSVSLDADTWMPGRLTATGMLLGTPAYMAPEQFVGKPSTERSDQYSFCVALYRALYRQWPYGGGALIERIQRANRGDIAPAPRDSPVPRRIFRVLAQGLRGDPNQRHSSMDALLDGLGRRSNARLPMAFVGAVGVLGLLAATQSSASRSQCSNADSRLEDVWDDGVRKTVAEQFGRIEAPFAAQTWADSAARLDSYAQQWVDQYKEACESYGEPGASASGVDQHMACLLRARSELNATVSLFASADAGVAAQTDELLAGLPPLEACRNATQNDEELRLPPPVRQTVTDLRSAVDRARTQRRAGRFEDATRTLDTARKDARDIDYGPIDTELELELGLTLQGMGEAERAETHLREALAIASQHGQRRELSSAASALLRLVAVQQARFEDSRRFVDIALEAAQGDPELLAQAHRAQGLSLMYRGELDDAYEHVRLALELLEDAYGEDDPRAASAIAELARVRTSQAKYDEAASLVRRLETLRETLPLGHPNRMQPVSLRAGILEKQGRYEEAQVLYAEVLTGLRHALGDAHPRTVAARGSLASIMGSQGLYAEAEAELRAVLQVVRAHNPRSRQVAHFLSALGNTLLRQRKLDDAERVQREALQIQLDTLGPDDPNTASTRGNLANVLSAAGKLAESEAQHRKTVEATVAAYGLKHPEVASAYNNLAVALSLQGKNEESLEAMKRALQIRENALPDNHPLVALSRNNVASMLVDAGRALEALPLAERAWKRRQQPDIPAPYRISSAHTLARALWDASDDIDVRRRSMELAELARKLAVEIGDDGRSQDIAAWQRERR